LKEDIDEEEMNVVHEEKQVENVFTCSQLDLLANTYRSSLHIMLGYTGAMAAAFKTHLIRFSMLGVTSSTNASALLNFNKYSNEDCDDQ
jgi:hypothetical protein